MVQGSSTGPSSGPRILTPTASLQWCRIARPRGRGTSEASPRSSTSIARNPRAGFDERRGDLVKAETDAMALWRRLSANCCSAQPRRARLSQTLQWIACGTLVGGGSGGSFSLRCNCHGGCTWIAAHPSSLDGGSVQRGSRRGSALVSLQFRESSTMNTSTMACFRQVSQRSCRGRAALWSVSVPWISG